MQPPVKKSLPRMWWFDRRRSLANGISAAGSGIGGLIFSFAAGAMIDQFGLAWSLRAIGLIALVANLLSASFIRDRNAIIRPKQRPFDLDLLRRWEVFFLLAWSFVSMLGYVTLLYSLSDFALSIDLSRKQATQITAFLNMGTAIGRPFIGVASDRFGRFKIASGLTLFCGVCCLGIWIPASSYGITVLFAIISGAILGVFWVTIGPLNDEQRCTKKVLLTVVGGLATVLQDQGKYEQAEEANRRALAEYEEALGRAHPDTLTCMSNLATMLQDQGKYKEAEEVNRRALAEYEEALGRAHPDTLTCMGNLATTLQDQGKYKEAEEVNRRALAEYESLRKGHSDPFLSIHYNGPRRVARAIF
ncbi:hypothetical protein B0A52_08034 [Exophiala mesophila]|uniref:Uncharacterized protein n=1 Tax=Exophiala mesophila TaxID=212818 RepID=A0A438MZ01_EXOME|nr:hypothetical protein B0A52_08034 [Exophiala mesophila]